MEYDFTLKFKLPGEDCTVDDLVERLGVAGCDDALLGIGVPGGIALNFTRDAQSAKEAILSALSDVKSAIPSVRLIEVGPDFVGLTDIADLIGVSRQNIRKLMVNHAATFPPAIHDGSASIWHLALVLQWLQSKGSYEIALDVLDVAHTAMHLNIVKEAELLSPSLRQEMHELVA